MDTETTYQAVIGFSPFVKASFYLFGLLTAAWLANFIVKNILLRMLNRAWQATEKDEEMIKAQVIPRLANIVPAVIIMGGIAFVPELPESLVIIIRNVCAAFVILFVAMAISAALNVANIAYNRNPDARSKPIKGYLQMLKVAAYVIAAILIIATLIDRSPLILLSGLGAMAAVLMLVFQDTLLSLVASVQISSSDMVRVGDWIEMPQLNADGDVIDIALHTVKVQNWDKTITTLPTKRLITEPFKNWRGMRESGGRRIKRALFLDQNTIHFITDEERKHLSRFKLLREYLVEKEREITEWNAHLQDADKAPMNMRRVTNIGTFRAYVMNYLRSHPQVNQDMTMLVRQLSPGAEGLPLEVYCFTNDTAWAVYEGVQSDIFDHLYSILPEFGLQAFQSPSGNDFRTLKGPEA